MSESKYMARASVDFMLRTTQQHHVQLSLMADQKAHIVIAFCSVIFSISISQISSMKLPWGFLTLASTSAASMIVAVLTIIPRFTKNKKKENNTSANPLFFGEFTNFSEEEYIGRMEEIFTSDEKVYEALLRYIYRNGLILKHKKYKYLRISYQILFLGLCLSMIVFIVELLLR